MIPDRFRERYSQIVDDPDAFFRCICQFVPKSFRVNTIKSDRKTVLERFAGYGMNIHGVPWYEDAFISESLEIGSTLEHFAGSIYIQELASMLPPLLMRKELEDARLVLDGCAAPGSKTTEIAAFMKNRGTIIANDTDFDRIRALKFNLEKCGVLNTIITNMDLRKYPPREFDAIFIDAPCSSEGTCRKSESLLRSWSERFIKKNSDTQKGLITKGFDMLAPDGAMIYSTCTYAPEENEAVLDHLLKSRSDARIEKISVPGLRCAQGITGWEGRSFDDQVRNAIRIWPHMNDTEGFFLAKVTRWAD